MGNVAVTEERAGLDELYKLDASEAEPEDDEDDEDEADDEDDDEDDDEGGEFQPEDMPHP